MSEFLSALREFFRPRKSRTRRRTPRLGNSAESLESRVLLSCVTATTDTQPAEVDVTSNCQDDGDDSHVDASGNEVHTIPVAEETGGATGDYDGTGAVADLSQTFFLHSNPGASHTIYLDFDGHVTSGTTWNTIYNDGNDIVTPAFSFEGDSSSFTDNELARIQRIWQRVAEDFLPFDVDVTTEDPGVDALSKSGSGDTTWGIRVVIGGNGSWYGSAGGVTYRGSFNWNDDTPAFVFSSQFGGSEKNIAEATSHETGHSLGLAHDGGPGTGYYKGHGSGETGWATIMGTGYSKNLTQWSQGEYSGATNTQDDLAIITSQNGFGYRADDYGNTSGTAENFVVVANSVNTTGIIEQNTDVDVFSFETGSGTIDIAASAAAIGPNLDILLELYNSSGQLVASSNPTDQLGATLTVAVAAGTYYLHVSGVGKGDPLNGGYTDYGSLGFYSITGTIIDPDAPDNGPRVISSSSGGAVGGTLDTFTLNFSEAIADGTFTTADVSLTGPGGAISPTAVNKLSSTQYEVTFTPQSAVGTYTLTVGPNITDTSGNAMDQDQDGNPGESTQDQYTTTAELTATRIIDDGDPDFSTTGSWSTGTQTAGLDGDYLAAPAGDGSDVATWTFTGLEPGEYRVSATWTTHSNRATDAPYTILDGSTVVATVDVNQEQTPADFTDAGVWWQDLGATYTITGDTLVVRLTNDANEYVIADAIRVERVGGLPSDTTGPRVTSSTSSGSVAGTIDKFTLTFSEAIADGTFTTADVTISGPGGAITPAAVNKLSSTQYEVTFASQSAVGTYTLTVGPNITDTAGNAMDQDQDGSLGEATQDQYTTSASILDTTGPRVISSTSSGASAGTLDTFTLTFSEAIADGTFTTADVSLSGPGGAITPSAVNKLSSTQYEVTFAAKSAVGTYTLTVGPNLADLAGNAMDQDQDGNLGESTQDRYTTTASILDTTGPRVISSTSSGEFPGALDKFILTFSEPIADGTFTSADVVLSGPGGSIPAAVNKLSSTQYEVSFAPQTSLGNYTLTVGPNITDVAGNAMDQDQDGNPGEATQDRYTTTASILDTTGPRVISSTSSGAVTGTLDTFTLNFSEAITDGTFTTADVNLTGPGGAITPTAVNKISSTQYEVTFTAESTVGTYTLTVGPNVTDLSGNVMDQDQDGKLGESTQDQYTTTASILDTTGPRVISSSSSGAVAGTLDTFTLTFSEAIADGTFTTADVGLSSPGGAITPAAVNKLSSTQYEVTFAAQSAVGTYTLTVGPNVADLAGNVMDQDQDGNLGEAAQDQYTTTASILDTTGPRVISSSSGGAVTGTLDTFTLNFSEAITDGTFTTADVNLTGPGGAITPTAVNKISSIQYEVTFAAQSAVGTYTLTVGPNVTDLSGNVMDQDQDGNLGEAAQDQYTTTASILDTTGPRVISSTSSGATSGTLDTFTLNFSEAIADGTFTAADVNLTGPGGAITPTAVNKLSSTQYEVMFAAQSAVGTYTLTVGPNILDPADNAMDQDEDGNLGEATQDQYTTSASILDTAGPRVISSSSSGASAGTLDTFTLTFSEAIADGTFTTADVSLSGPGGAITPTAVNKLSGTQYEVTFAAQSAVGTYTLTVGPNITDLSGNAMDQDQDGNLGESTQDQYTTSASILDTTGPRVISSSSSGAVAGTLDTFTLTFNEALADGTFTTADVSISGPGAAITPTVVNKLSSTQYEVTFAAQSAVGTYTLTVGPNITDVAGNAMDQDQDGSLGESTQDQYTTSAPILDTTGPRVVSSTSSGATAGTLDTFTLTFSEVLADGTFTTADVSISGPGAAITPTAVNKLSSTQYEVTFAPQSAVGTYTLTVGPNITDVAGHAMDQDQDGNIGEATQDRYITSATVSSPGFWYDFGDATSPVSSGYEQVTGDMLYDASTGHGWWRRTVASEDQGTGSELTRDFNSYWYSRFMVDLENGTYDVTVTLGDALTARDQMGINLENQWLDTDINTAAGEFVARTYRVEVTDGQLLLLLRDFGGSSREFAINALQVVPVGAQDNTGPQVLAAVGSGAASDSIDTFMVMFSEPIADGTFTAADVALSGPSGSITPAAVTKLNDTQYEVTFAPQTQPGMYTIAVGPQVTDLAGNAMDQDSDGNLGETGDDVFSTSVEVGDVTGPRVLTSSAGGSSAGTLDKFTVTFSEAIADGTLTAADVSLTGPGGAITPTAVNKISGTQYEITFAPQSVAGSYTLVVGPQVADLAGNQMDQDQDGTAGEVADDRYTTTATLQPPGSEWYFDFGEAGSPVASGYDQVTRFTEYQSSLGYGWVPGTMVSDNDSNKGDDLQRDYNYTRNGTFAVDLPDGTYEVTVTLGDSRHHRDLMSVSLEGTEVDLVSTKKGEFVTRTYRVVVTDGQLSMQLQDLGGKDNYATINALSIVAV